MTPVSQSQIDDYTNNGWWGEESVLDILYQNAAKTPEHIALVDPYNKEQIVGLGAQPRQLTHRELSQNVDTLALNFKDLGIGHDDVILIQLPNIVESLLTLFAAARIGAIASPLAMQARSHELNHAAERTNARAILTVSSFHNYDHMDMMRRVQEKNPSLEHIIIVGPEAPKGALHFERLIEQRADAASRQDELKAGQSGPNEVFTLCWTSGTEAEPKGVPRTHNQWISIARVVVEGTQLFNGAAIHGTFPMINMAGIGGLLIPWVMTGGKFVLHHPFDLESFFPQLIKEEIYYTLMPPALLVTLAKSQRVNALKQSKVEVVASGSTPLAPWMVKFFQEECNIGIVNFFASNEGVALFSIPKLFPNPEDRATYFPRFGGQGVQFDLPHQVIGGMKSRLIKPESGEVITETGEIGELGFSGPTMFSGYWKRPELNEKSFDKDGFYRSGDLFSIEGDRKEKLLFQGRLKDLIIRGGYNISPEEVEIFISKHPAVKEVAVAGYPDERLGQRIGVAIVPFEGQEITMETLKQYLEENGLAKYKWPEKLKIVETLPRSPLQKVLKREVKKLLTD